MPSRCHSSSKGQRGRHSAGREEGDCRSRQPDADSRTTSRRPPPRPYGARGPRPAPRLFPGSRPPTTPPCRRASEPGSPTGTRGAPSATLRFRFHPRNCTYAFLRLGAAKASQRCVTTVKEQSRKIHPRLVLTRTARSGLRRGGQSQGSLMSSTLRGPPTLRIRVYARTPSPHAQPAGRSPSQGAGDTGRGHRAQEQGQSRRRPFRLRPSRGEAPQPGLRPRPGSQRQRREPRRRCRVTRTIKQPLPSPHITSRREAKVPQPARRVFILQNPLDPFCS